MQTQVCKPVPLSLPSCFPPECLDRSLQPGLRAQHQALEAACEVYGVLINLFALLRQDAKISLKTLAFRTPQWLPARN